MTAPIPRDIPDLPAIPGMVAPTLLPSGYVPATAVMKPVRRPLTAVFRLLVAGTAAAGVTIELLVGSPVRVLSHFAIQSNILLAVVMALSARRAWSARRPLPALVTGAVLLYIVITALVHHLLLTGTTPTFSLTNAPGVHPFRQTVANHILVTITPAAAVLDWLLLTTPGRLHLRQAATWLLYPLAYLLFCLGRGELILPGTPGRYLYPFLDADRHGYKGALANALLLGLSFYALAILLVALDHVRPDPMRHLGKTGFRLRPPVG
ncbi:Pr6Pr family membrane protein [Streptomyces sp. NPDC059378]|uniref:Pr6Pr family membrane protein n=1 Tax=Streptomyces sp. NPDC059378 TaxID=3346815 RepID=UPI00369B5BAB